jgi:hypothetical protein
MIFPRLPIRSEQLEYHRLWMSLRLAEPFRSLDVRQMPMKQPSMVAGIGLVDMFDDCIFDD